VVAWSDLPAWQRQLDGSARPICADAHLETNEFSRLIAELRQSYARLAPNQYRRGYGVVVLKRHANEVFELSDAVVGGVIPVYLTMTNAIGARRAAQSMGEARLGVGGGLELALNRWMRLLSDRMYRGILLAASALLAVYGLILLSRRNA